MGRTSIRLSESSTSSLTHVDTEMPGEPGEAGKKGKGCYLNAVNGLIIVLAAIALSTAVGLIVHFAHPCKKSVPCGQVTTAPPKVTTVKPTSLATTPSMDQVWEMCKNLSRSRNECLPGQNCSTTPLPPSTTIAPKPQNIRLPDNLKPSHYNLHLRPFIYSKNPADFHFNGSVQIYVDCLKQTSVITLHSKGHTVSKIIVRDEGTNNEIQISKTEIEESLNFFHIHVSSPLKPNNKYVIYSEFSGPLKKDLKGIYYSDYNIDGEIRYLVTSQMQSTDARKVFPCFDEPAMKSTFNTTIERKGNLDSMSNTEIYESEDSGDGWIADKYTTTPYMSAYLLAIMVTDFNCTKSFTSNGKLVEICARSNALAQTEFATSIAGDMQEFFERYHNITYPLPKTIHAAVQDFAAGAMENWGLIIYRETALLYDEGTATAGQRQGVAKVIAHELAHQWFGNLVTANWWDDTWLNEGFASYLENLGTHDSFPKWDVLNEMVVTKVQRVFVEDSLASSRPIHQEVNDYAGISQAFDSITYSKGAAVIRMMRHFLGEETFRWGLSNYLKDRAYKTATSADLFKFMSEQARSDGQDIDVDKVMRTWVDQMGYPVVHVFYDAGKGVASLQQKHFLINPRQKVTRPSQYGYQWKVPISIVTDKTADHENFTQGWLNEKSGQIAGVDQGGSWILANVKQRYYFRVNYDQSNWNALVEQLLTNKDKIHRTNRAQILDDSINLGRAGEVDQTLALNVSLYLREERAYIPWVSAARGFSYMDSIISQTTFYGNFKTFMQDNIRNTYNETGWDKNPTDSHLTRRLRTLISSMACKYEDVHCLNQAKIRYNEWMKTEEFNNTNNINPDLQPVVYCHGIQMGGQKEWDFAFAMYQKVNSGSEKSNLLSALGCTKEEWLLRRYLQEALDETVLRRQDFHIVVRHVSRMHSGRVLAWHFVQDNWNLIKERFGDSTFALRRVVEVTTYSFSTERELAEVKNFMVKYPDQGNAAAAFKTAVETITANIAWRNDNEMKIKNWLEELRNNAMAA